MNTSWIDAIARILALSLTLIACPSNIAWAGSVKVTELPVSAVTIYPGNVIKPEFIKFRRFRTTYAARLPVARNTQQLIGMVARRTLLPGYPIAVNALRKPYLVKRGQMVRVVYVSGGLNIASFAMPMRSGSAGDVIQLRNPESGSFITGIVQPNGVLRVGDR